jgi:hypothetical protein
MFLGRLRVSWWATSLLIHIFHTLVWSSFPPPQWTRFTPPLTSITVLEPETPLMSKFASSKRRILWNRIGTDLDLVQHAVGPAITGIFATPWRE